MRCKNCPYGVDDFTRRTEMYKSVYGKYPDEDRKNISEQFIWCDKVGGKVYNCGHCTDWYENDKENCNNHSKGRKRNKRERYIKHKKHLKHLYEIVGDCYPTPVTYEDEIWVRNVGYVKRKKSKRYYKRLYRGKASKYLKQQSHKKVRKYKGDLHNGNMSHKLYDFWWNFC